MVHARFVIPTASLADPDIAAAIVARQIRLS